VMTVIPRLYTPLGDHNIILHSYAPVKAVAASAVMSWASWDPTVLQMKAPNRQGPLVPNASRMVCHHRTWATVIVYATSAKHAL